VEQALNGHVRTVRMAGHGRAGCYNYVIVDNIIQTFAVIAKKTTP